MLETTMTQRSEVVYCSIDRVGGHSFLIICTTVRWMVYRLDKFSATRELCSPLQLVFEETRDSSLIENVRILRLYAIPCTAFSTTIELGGFFVCETSREVDYTQPTDAPSNEAHETMIAFSFNQERILRQLPPTLSSVVDVQIQQSTAAVLCESHTILMVNLETLCIEYSIQGLVSLALSLGPRWIAYPACVETPLEEDGSDCESVEILKTRTTPLASHLSGNGRGPGSLTAVDVAQNVASGLYYLSKTIVPYLSSSPSTSPDDNGQRHERLIKPSQGGWVVIQDLKTSRVITNFKCHSTALANLVFDPSGSLLATSSIKGQNVHIYRLLPILQGLETHRQSGEIKSDKYQLLYKLQRGITHACVIDMMFSMDSKWISVTSNHGTSHMYAIHPDGAPISVATHATVSSEDGDKNSTHTPSDRHRDVLDFCAPFRAIETKKLSQVLKIYHSSGVSLRKSGVNAASAAMASLGASMSILSVSPTTESIGSSPGTSLVGSALDASQALWSHLAQSTAGTLTDFTPLEELDLHERRRRRRKRFGCLFAHDGAKMIVCCETTLKLFDLSAKACTRRQSGGSNESMNGLHVSVSELKAWELEGITRLRSESMASLSSILKKTVKLRLAHEMRTFRQYGPALWAHPKVFFRVTDSTGQNLSQILHVKRKGPSQEIPGVIHRETESQVFVMEMDTYFGISSSPLFTGQPANQNLDVPPMDLAESINMAMSAPVQELLPSSPTHVSDSMIITSVSTNEKKRKGKKKRDEQSGSSTSSASNSPSILHFTLQDMYFGQPTTDLSSK